MKQIPNDLFFAWVEEELAQGRQVRIRVKGTSMRPFLRNGVDDVIIAPCPAESLAQSDVILFRYRGRHLMHRIVGRRDTEYILQGDGVWASQEHCSPTDVLGKVTHVCRSGCHPLPVTSLRWRCPSRLWHLCRPLRRWLLYFCR